MVLWLNSLIIALMTLAVAMSSSPAVAVLRWWPRGWPTLVEQAVVPGHAAKVCSHQQSFQLLGVLGCWQSAPALFLLTCCAVPAAAVACHAGAASVPLMRH